MPKILSEEERQKSKEKRQEYLKKWREEHGMEYYENNKEKIKKQQREKREEKKGKPINSYNRINLKDMTEEERRNYHVQKMREYRERKKSEQKRDILKKFIEEYKEVQELYKDDPIQAEIERSCYFEEVPFKEIKTLIERNEYLEKENIRLGKLYYELNERCIKYNKTVEDVYVLGLKVERENIVRNLEEYLFNLKKRRENDEITIGYWQVKTLVEKLIDEFRF